MLSEHSRIAVGRVYAEAERYIGASEVGLVGQSGSVVLPVTAQRMASGGGFDERVLITTLEAALHLAQLRFAREYLAAMLIHYPVVAGGLTVDEVGEQLGDVVGVVADLMLDVAERFEDRVPWLRPRMVEGARASAIAGGKKWRWRERTQSRGPSAFLSIAQIPEVAIAKIVERLYVLQAADRLGLEPDTTCELGQQSLDVHAVVAEMLGLWSVKSRLEDVAFKIVDRAGYDAIAHDLAERLEERQGRIARAIEDLRAALSEAQIKAEITGRPKHLYSIFQKVRHTGLSVGEVNDALGVRVVVDGGDADDPEGCQQCYEVLSLLFKRWPMQAGVYEGSEGKPYRDWIERPKPTGYQSIPTTRNYEGRPLEVQIRSRAMHDLAEYGAAAHWVYKQDGSSSLSQTQYDKFLERIARVRRMFEERQKRFEKPFGNETNEYRRN